MESFLRDGVDLRGLPGRTIAGRYGDAHFFEDSATPEKVKTYLESAKVKLSRIMYLVKVY